MNEEQREKNLDNREISLKNIIINKISDKTIKWRKDTEKNAVERVRLKMFNVFKRPFYDKFYIVTQSDEIYKGNSVFEINYHEYSLELLDEMLKSIKPAIKSYRIKYSFWGKMNKIIDKIEFRLLLRRNNKREKYIRIREIKEKV